jgi:ferredoxin-NADP reductase
MPGPRTFRLKSSTPEVEGVRSFVFDPGTPRWEWRAGQNLVMTLPGVDDPRGPVRPFTISSSPTESDGIRITTMLRGSPFKEHLTKMAVGDPVEVEGPEGEFFLEPGRPAVMVAGGIGVTPFRSMLRFATDTGLEKPLVLVDSNKSPERIVFRKELDELARRNRGIRILHTITEPSDGGERWTGRTGRVDADLLRDALRGVRHPLVYLAGPPGFVRANRKLLLDEIHISEADVRTDEFEGY